MLPAFACVPDLVYTPGTGALCFVCATLCFVLFEALPVLVPLLRFLLELFTPFGILSHQTPCYAYLIISASLTHHLGGSRDYSVHLYHILWPSAVLFVIWMHCSPWLCA